MLHPLGTEGLLVDGVRLGEAGVDITYVAMHLGRDVARGVSDAGCGGQPGVQHRRAWRHREVRVEDRGQRIVVDPDQSARQVRGARTVGHDGGDALPGEPDGAVEHHRVAGVVVGVMVPRRREAGARCVRVAEHGGHAGQPERRGRVDRADPGVRVRRPQQLHVQQTLDLRVESEPRPAGDDVRPGGRG